MTAGQTQITVADGTQKIGVMNIQTVASSVTSNYGLRMGDAYVTEFRGIDDLSTIVDIDFGATRYNRALGTISYDVTITNNSDTEIVLPALLTLDPQRGYAGLPTANEGQNDQGVWLVDLSASLPADGKLPSGATTSGQTISVATPDRQRVLFSTGVVASTAPNRAPRFTGEVPDVASVGQELRFNAIAEDPDGQTVIYDLLTGPEGMTVDMVTGEVVWTPTPEHDVQVPVVIQAFDSRGAVAVQRFILNVDGGNSAPVFIAMPTQLNSSEGETLEVELVAADPDADDVVIWVDNLPEGASYNPETRILTWTIGYDQAGTYNITVHASDGIADISANITALISEVARPVSLHVPASINAVEGDRIRFYLDAEAEPGTPLSFGVFNNSLPLGATLNASTGEFEWVPGFIQAGTYEIMFAVSDGIGVAMNTTVIEVTNGNGAPVFDNFDGLRVYEGQRFALRAFASDPDNPYYEPTVRTGEGELFEPTDFPKTVEIEVVGDLPDGATFDADTWELKWVPGATQAGTYDITFRATDDGNGTGTPAVVTETVTIEVLDLNRGPQLAELGNVEIARGEVLEIPISAVDPEGDPVTLGAKNEQPGYPLPDFITFIDNGDGTGVLRLAPGVGDRGEHPIQVYAHDNGGDEGVIRGSGYTFVIDVLSDNEPPQFEYQGSVVAKVGETLQLEINASDMDADDLTFDLSGLPLGAVLTMDPLIYGRATLSWNPEIGNVGTYAVTVTATDTGADGLTDPAETELTFNLSVRTTNSAPVLDPVGTISGTESTPLSYDFNAGDDDGDGITYSVEDLPRNATFDRETGEFNWLPSSTQAGTYQMTVTASDGHSSSSETVTLVIAELNRAPVFVPMTTQFGRDRAELRFTVVSDDADGDPVVMSVIDGLPEGAYFNEETGQFSWIPQYDQSGDYVITFGVQDPSGASDTLEVTVSIADVNRAPELVASDRSFLIGEEKSFTLEASDPDGNPLTFRAINLPEGAVLNEATGEVTWLPGPGQAGDYYVTFLANDGKREGRQTIVMRASLEPIEPTVRIELTPSFPAVPGQPVLVQVVADSLSDITGMTLYVDGVETALDALGRAVVVPDVPGKIALRATATDADGIEGAQELTLKVRDPADRLAPIVALDSVLSRGASAGVVEIGGFVEESNLDYWVLELLDAEGNLLRELATDETTGDLTFATLDTGTLLNGFYQLRLTAMDIGGRMARVLADMEVKGRDKTGFFADERIDLSVDLGGFTFDLIRRYNSLAPQDADFGTWSAGFDTNLAVNTDTTGREAVGLYAAMQEGTRLYLTAPDGTRLGFTFAPVVKKIGDLNFYTPAWVADEGSDWQLSSNKIDLRKAGGRFYTTDSAIPYNVEDPFIGGEEPFVLTGPDGTAYVLATDGRIQEIRTATKRLFVGDSGITAASGEVLSFLRDAEGRIARATSSSGESVVYSYDELGQLIGVRKLNDGTGARYGYADGLLTSLSEIGGTGRTIAYNADGSVTEAEVEADLGGVGQVVGQVTDVPAGNSTYTFTIRDNEVAAAAGGRMILRIALSGEAATPNLEGAGLLSLLRNGGQTVALYSVERGGFYRIDVDGPDTEMEISIAGDINLDGSVNGVDSDLLRAGGPGTDIDGDGDTDQQDRQILNVNFGIKKNGAPIQVETLPEVFTHVELPILVALDDIAVDEDGDRMFFRIVGEENVDAELTADGNFLRIRPNDGFSGVGTFTVIADDGFTASEEIEVEVDVSDAPLTNIELATRVYRFSSAGEVSQVIVIGDFADQEDVILPFDYVDVQTMDPEVAVVNSNGILTTRGDGDTALVARRGGIADGTVVTVGVPNDPDGMISLYYGIDAYPDSVTILPNGGSRQIVTSVGTDQEQFVQGAGDGVMYIAHDDGIITVNEDGLIEAVSEGRTKVTVLYRNGEETIDVSVIAPQVGASAEIGSAGGAIQTDDGIVAAFGAGQLEDGATVNVSSISEANLDTAPPPDFNFLAALNLEVENSEINGPIQLATPIDPAVAAPGEEVFFFIEVDYTEITNGEYGKLWTIVDSGTVGADGVARTASPPFPGMSKNGNILVAKANKPLNYMSVYSPLLAVAAAMILPAMVMAAPAGLIGLSVASSVILGSVASVVSPRVQDLKAWNKYGEMETTTIDPTGITGDTFRVSVDIPPAPTVPPAGVEPIFTQVAPEFDSAGNVKLKMIGANLVEHDSLFSIEDSRIRMQIGNYVQYIYGDEFTDVVVSDNELSAGTFKFDIPNDILATRATFTYQRRGPGIPGEINENWINSADFTIANTQGYGVTPGSDYTDGVQRSILSIFDTEGVGSQTAGQVVKDLHITDENGANLTWLNDVVLASDNSAAYVATFQGIAVVDMLTLQQFDVDPTTEGTDIIRIPGGNVQKVTISGDGNWLYAAGSGKIYVIDLRPGSSTYLQYLPPISVNIPGSVTEGQINDIELSSDSKKLYVAVPDGSMFGTDGWVRGAGKEGSIFVINVDPKSRPEGGMPGGPQKYLQVIDVLNGFTDPYDITATSDPNKMAFTSRGDTKHGFHTIIVTNSNPAKYAASVKTFDGVNSYNNRGQQTGSPQQMLLNYGQVMVKSNSLTIPSFIGPIYIPYYSKVSAQKYDLDIRNATGVQVTPDLKYAFVADYHLSRYFTMSSELAYEIELRHDVGSKIGMIRNPFGMSETEWNQLETTGVKWGETNLVSATSPIPMQFLQDLALTPDASKLYALFRAAGVVIPYDVENWILEFESREGQNDPSVNAPLNRIWPIDLMYDEVDEFGQPRNNPFVFGLNPDAPNTEVGIEVAYYARGLDVQLEPGIKLMRPVSQNQAHGEDADEFIFEVELDPDAFGVPEWKMDLYFSTQPQRQGLFPDDPERDRSFYPFSGGSVAENNQKHRILLNTSLTAGEFAFKSGYYYELDAFGAIASSRPLTSDDVPAELIKHRVQVKMSEGHRQMLTGGQTYYWGVDVTGNDQVIRRSTSFQTEAVPTDGHFSTVTVITHGMDFAFFPDYANTALGGHTSRSENNLERWLEAAEIFDEAGGGGTILVYNRQTGLFHEYDPASQRINMSTSFNGADLQQDEPVTIVMDWLRESDISDTGFAEAAADAFFASLAHLDRQTSNKLLDGPMHFIGHERGAVVNSEIVQRIGHVYTDSAPRIHMTTLDPHDQAQGSLAINGPSVISNYLSTARNIAVLVTPFYPPAAGVAQRIQKAKDAFEKLMRWISYTGLQLQPIPYNDFKDPNVLYWDNIDFFDNYYQTSVTGPNNPPTSFPDLVFGSLGNLIGQAFSGYSITTTFEGTKIPSTAVPGYKVTPDIELGFTDPEVPGFTDDDFGGTPSTRIVNWYLGTADVNAKSIGGDLIYRNYKDEGVDLQDGGWFTDEFTGQPWYGASASFFENNQVGDWYKDYFKNAKSAVTNPALKWTANEAVGTGYYFAEVAGDVSKRPTTGEAKIPTSYDNTEAGKVANEPVTTIFNGNFELGTRHSISNYIKWLFTQVATNATSADERVPDTDDPNVKYKPRKKGLDGLGNLPAELGRFPYHFDLPGWSMHGGVDVANDGGEDEGYSYAIKLLENIAPSLFGGPVDITGLFLVNTNVILELIDLLKLAVQPLMERLVFQLAKADSDRDFIKDYNTDQAAAVDQKMAADAATQGWTKFTDTDGTVKYRDSSGTTLFTEAQYKESITMYHSFGQKWLDPLNSITSQLNLALDYLNGVAANAPSEEAKALQKGIAWFKALPPELTNLQKMRDVFSMPETTAEQRNAKRAALKGVAKWLSDNIFLLAAQALGILDKNIGDLAKPDYGLIFGGGQVIKTLVQVFTPEIELPGLDGKSLADLIVEKLDQIGNLDTVTHNRMFVPRDVDELKMDVFVPLALSEGLTIEVTFTDLDGNVYDSGSHPGLKQVINPQFFTTNTVTFPLPEGIKDNVVNMTISNSGLEYDTSDDYLNLLNDIGATETALIGGLLGDLADTAGGLSSAVSTLMILDDVRFASSSNPQTAVSEGAGGQPALTLEAAQALAEVARGIWADSGLVPDTTPLDSIMVAIGDLDGAHLAETTETTITLDSDAAGHGWFVDATPLANEEFDATSHAHLFTGSIGGPVEDRIDLLTVMLHEMGNALGLTDYPGLGDPSYLMNALLDTGERRLPSGPDVQDYSGLETEEEDPFAGEDGLTNPIAPGSGNAAASSSGSGGTFGGHLALLSGDPEAFGNGRFSAGLTNWVFDGDVTTEGGEAVLREADVSMTGMGQTFALPAAATGLQFTIRDLDLNQTEGSAPDAFEVALLDAVTGTSVLGDPVGLPGTDAFLNIQSDGSRFLSANVSVVENGTDLIVTIDFDGLTLPEAVLLSFDLIGFGVVDSRANIDDVRLLGLGDNTAPVAVDDTATTDEDMPVTIDLLANDTDGEGDPLIVEIIEGPAAGTLTALGDGTYSYTPDANANGTDSFTYRVNDGDLDSAPATVTITVTPVNDDPAIDPVGDLTLVAGAALALNIQATDADLEDVLTFSLGTVPEGASIDPVTGALVWDSTGFAGPQSFTVIVEDGQGGSADVTFVVDVQASPVFADIGPVTMTVGDPVSILPVVTDADSDPADLSFEKLEGPDWILVDPETGAVSGDSTGHVGEYTVKLQVTDEDGLTGMVTFALVVEEADIVRSASVVVMAGPLVAGPGQLVQLPSTSVKGVPLSFTVDANVTEIIVDLGLEAAAFEVDQVKAGAEARAGDVVELLGTGQIRITLGSPIAAGTYALADLVLKVKEGAAYGSLQDVTVEVTEVDGLPVETEASMLTVVIGYIGDLDGDGALGQGDVQMAAYFSRGMLQSLTTWQEGVSPLLIGDVDRSGAITSLDASMISGEYRGVDVDVIPDVPGGFTVTFDPEHPGPEGLVQDPPVYQPRSRTTTQTTSLRTAPTSEPETSTPTVSTLTTSRSAPVTTSRDTTVRSSYSRSRVTATRTMTVSRVSDMDRGDFPVLRDLDIPLVIESDGGVREMEFAIRFDDAALSLRDVALGPDLPAGTRIDMEETAEGLIVRLSLAETLDLPVAELLRLKARPVGDASDALERAGMTIETLSVNGVAVDQPVQLARAGEAAVVELGDHALPQGKLAMTLGISDFGADVAVPGLIDPDLLADGLLPIFFDGVEGAQSLVMEVHHDRGFELSHAAEGVTLEIVEPGLARVTVDLLSVIVTGSVAAAALRVVRRADSLPLGRIDLASLEVDGVDLSINPKQDVSGLTLDERHWSDENRAG